MKIKEHFSTLNHKSTSLDIGKLEIRKFGGNGGESDFTYQCNSDD